MGLLKLKRPGSGVDELVPQRLQANFSLKRNVTGGRCARLFENHFARFAITDLDGVDDALVQIRRDRQFGPLA